MNAGRQALAEIEIDAEWTRLATEFAEASLASRKSKLASRGQSNQAKIKTDIVCGAVAEFAVKAQLEKSGYAVSDPDLKVYAARQKSWAPDLTAHLPGCAFNTKKIHVKTYNNPKWGSWVFTYNPTRGDMDPLVTTPGEDDWLVLTEVDVKAGVVRVWFEVRADRVKTLYRPPLLPQLAYSKVVLYPEDLDKLTF